MGVSANNKRKVYIRDRGCCQLCGYYIHDKAQISIDHKKPQSKKGSSAIDNLQLSHASCNRKKGSRNNPLPKYLGLGVIREYPDYVIINAS